MLVKSKKQKANAAHAASEDTAHTLGIVSSLLSNLASDSPARIRLLAKFVENSYEKPEKLLEIRDAARTRLKATDKELEDEKKVRRHHDIDLWHAKLMCYISAWRLTERTSREWKTSGTSDGWTAVCSRCRQSTISWHGSQWRTMA